MGRGLTGSTICCLSRFLNRSRIEPARSMKGGANSLPASWEAVDVAEVTRKVVPQVTASSIPAFVIYGHHRSIANQRNVIALRECFYAQWRAQRNAAISGHKSTRDQVRNNLNKRLQAGILRDWTRGSSPLKFNKRWLPYASHGTDGPCFHKFPSVRDGTIT